MEAQRRDVTDAPTSLTNSDGASRARRIKLSILREQRPQTEATWFHLIQQSWRRVKTAFKRFKACRRSPGRSGMSGINFLLSFSRLEFSWRCDWGTSTCTIISPASIQPPHSAWMCLKGFNRAVTFQTRRGYLPWALETLICSPWVSSEFVINER